MPIGKNAIQRVANNTYSNVKSTAPDMENSAVAEEKAVSEAEKKAPEKKKSTASANKTTVKKSAPAKTTAKKTAASTTKKQAAPTIKKTAIAPKFSMETEPELAPVRTLEKIVEKSSDAPTREGDGYINLGGKLPYYLL